MKQTAAVVITRTTHVRYTIVLMLFAASTFSYGDRVLLSIAAADISRDLDLNALRLGYLFSAFSWAYAAAQPPAGSLLDRFGSRRVYGISIACWSCCAFLSGFAGYASAALSTFFLHCGFSLDWLNRPSFLVTDVSWPRGFLPPSVAAPLRSSIHRSTFRW